MVMEWLSYENVLEFLEANSDHLLIDYLGKCREHFKIRVERRFGIVGEFFLAYEYSIAEDREIAVLRLYKRDFELIGFDRLRENGFAFNTVCSVDTNADGVPVLRVRHLHYVDYMGDCRINELKCNLDATEGSDL